MLTKNNTSSDLTMKIQNRMKYANYIIQQQAVSSGCLQRVITTGGSAGDNVASTNTDIKEGELFTTNTEKELILANNICVGPPPDPYLSDKIYLSLTTNAAAYKAAPTGSWIAVTSTEYTTLQSTVSNTSVAGINVTDFETQTYAGNYSAFNLFVANRANATAAAISANTYLYAFAIITALPTISRVLDSIYVYANGSTGTYSGFSIVGSGPLPSLTAGKNYFVRKGASTVSAATNGLLAISAPGDGTPAGSQSYNIPYSTSLANRGFQVTYGVGLTLPATSSTTLDNYAANFSVPIQGLTSTAIQWVT